MRNFLILFFLTNASLTYAQDSTFKYQALIVAAGSSSNYMPFWGHTNQNGVIPLNGNFASGQWGIYKIYNRNNPRSFQWSGGVELVTNYEQSGKIFLTDFYAAGKLGPVEFLAGQKKNITGLMDTTLTSGSLSVSGNARPYPRIQISIQDFFPLGFTNDWVAIKFSYSDGMLSGSNINYGSTSYVNHTYFHQKTFYFKLGKSHDYLHIFGGINHQVIWGGEKKISPVSNLSTMESYWLAITGKTNQYKKIGDHFGTFDLGLEWKGAKWSYYGYRQNIYETSSLFKITHLKDGLNGMRIKRNKPAVSTTAKFILNSFLFEFVSTKDQINNSPIFGLAIFDKADYLNSVIYANGWSYKGRVIGTPLISDKDITNNNLPETSTQFSNNNRVRAYHTGFEGTFLRTSLMLKCTYSQNSGTYLSPFDVNKNQFSVALTAEKNVTKRHNLSILACVSTDVGKLYPNSNSILIGVRKNGYLNKMSW